MWGHKWVTYIWVTASWEGPQYKHLDGTKVTLCECCWIRKK